VRSQFDRINRARLFAHSAVNAPQFINIKLLGIFFAIWPWTFLRDDVDAVRRAGRRAHHARDAAHATVLVLVQSMNAAKCRTKLAALFDGSVIAFLLGILHNPEILFVGAVAPKVLDEMSHGRAKSFNDAGHKEALAQCQRLGSDINNFIITNWHGAEDSRHRQTDGTHYYGAVNSTNQPSRRAAESNDQAQTRIGWRMMGLGWQFVTEMLAGAFLGWWIGRWLGNETVGALIGTGCGLVVATYFLIRGALKLNSILDRMDKAKGIKPPAPLMEDRSGKNDAE